MRAIAFRLNDLYIDQWRLALIVLSKLFFQDVGSDLQVLDQFVLLHRLIAHVPQLALQTIQSIIFPQKALVQLCHLICEALVLLHDLLLVLRVAHLKLLVDRLV